MKITLCGSIAFYDKMLDVKKELERTGHRIQLPPLEIKNDKGKMISVKEYYDLRKTETDPKSWVWKQKTLSIKSHFAKIEWGDAILVTNYDKNGVQGYIGGNTLMEMGIALHLKKPIYLLHQIPELAYKEEILGMRPTVINRDFSLLA